MEERGAEEDDTFPCTWGAPSVLVGVLFVYEVTAPLERRRLGGRR